MKLVQYTGPFSSGESLLVNLMNCKYMHIGVQTPYNWPYSWQDSNGNWVSEPLAVSKEENDFKINNGTYSIYGNGILEHDCEFTFGNNSIKITFSKDFPMETIIDVIYSE